MSLIQMNLKDIFNAYLCRLQLFVTLGTTQEDILNTYLCRLGGCVCLITSPKDIIKALLNKIKQTCFCAESRNSPLKDIINTYLCRLLKIEFCRFL